MTIQENIERGQAINLAVEIAKTYEAKHPVGDYKKYAESIIQNTKAIVADVHKMIKESQTLCAPKKEVFKPLKADRTV